MRCPVCKEKVSEMDTICPNCKTDIDGNNKKCYANYLNFMANLNIFISIVGATIIWSKFSIIEHKAISIYATSHSEINWWGIVGGFAVLVSGFTLFFLLKTICDIYWEVK